MSAFFVKGVNVSGLRLGNRQSSITGLERLAIAVVETACQDYRSLRRRLVRERDVRERAVISGRIHEIELFFKSEYGDVLCFGKADYILRLLEVGG